MKNGDVDFDRFIPKKYQKKNYKGYGRPPTGSLTEMRAKKAGSKSVYQ
jgi:hypothetical protein